MKLQNIPGLQTPKPVDYRFIMPRSSFEHHPVMQYFPPTKSSLVEKKTVSDHACIGFDLDQCCSSAQ